MHLDSLDKVHIHAKTYTNIIQNIKVSVIENKMICSLERVLLSHKSIIINTWGACPNNGDFFIRTGDERVNQQLVRM